VVGQPQALTRIAHGAAAVAVVVALSTALMVTQPAEAQEAPFQPQGSCRDGVPHGAYELHGPRGQLRVAGAFSNGKRTGSFLFWSSNGSRLAQMPFEGDVLSGTLALWYLPGGGVKEARPKLEAAYVKGRLTGPKRSWYPNGSLRTEFQYDNGALTSARAFNETGRALSEGQARALAARDEATDRDYFASLDAIVRRNLPRCTGDRREHA
jgi:hypothetical protein